MTRVRYLLILSSKVMVLDTVCLLLETLWIYSTLPWWILYKELWSRILVETRFGPTTVSKMKPNRQIYETFHPFDRAIL